MPRIRCLYFDCMYLDEEFCTAASIEIDPDIGCTTYSQNENELLYEIDEEDDDDWVTEGYDMEEDEDEEEPDDDDLDWD